MQLNNDNNKKEEEEEEETKRFITHTLELNVPKGNIENYCSHSFGLLIICVRVYTKS